MIGTGRQGMPRSRSCAAEAPGWRTGFRLGLRFPRPHGKMNPSSDAERRINDGDLDQMQKTRALIVASQSRARGVAMCRAFWLACWTVPGWSIGATWALGPCANPNHPNPLGRSRPLTRTFFEQPRSTCTVHARTSRLRPTRPGYNPVLRLAREVVSQPRFMQHRSSWIDASRMGRVGRSGTRPCRLADKYQSVHTVPYHHLPHHMEPGPLMITHARVDRLSLTVSP